MPFRTARTQATTRLGEEAIDLIVDNTCVVLTALAGTLATPSLLFDPEAVDIWSAQIDANEAGTMPIEPPMLIVQGDIDDIIGEHFTDELVKRQCKFGATVQYSVYPGAGHASVLSQADPDILEWMAGRLAGNEAPSNC